MTTNKEIEQKMYRSFGGRRYHQGYYKLKNPKKYVGKNKDKIRFMSSWERKFHEFLDNNVSVLEWGSECLAIPYLKPTDNQMHRYFPDYYIKYKDKYNQVVEEIIEIKPSKQLQNSADLMEALMFSINTAKWKAAEQYCKQHGYRFRILTERELFRRK
jgi:hypothetical protein